MPNAHPALQKVIEVALASDPAAHAQDVRGRGVRIERDEIARSPPQISRSRQQIVRLEGLLALHAQRGEVQLEPTALFVVWVEIDCHQHGLARIGSGLAVDEQRVVVATMEHEPAVALQRLILAANPIYARDEVRETVGALQLPAAQLVLLRVAVLLAPWLARLVLEQLEGRTID